MSAGSERITVRLVNGMRALMEEEVKRRNRRQKNDRPWTVTDWVQHAIAEKLSHCKRTRKEEGQYRVDRPDEGLPAIFLGPHHDPRT